MRHDWSNLKIHKEKNGCRVENVAVEIIKIRGRMKTRVEREQRSPPPPPSLQSPPLSFVLLVATATGEGQKTRREKCADWKSSKEQHVCAERGGRFVVAVRVWQRWLKESHAHLFQKPEQLNEIKVFLLSNSV